MRLGTFYAHLLTVKKMFKGWRAASFLLAGVMLYSLPSIAQPAYTQVTNTSGATGYNGVTVTVTSSGSVSSFTPCGSATSPYYFGGGSGSYTFSFSSPVGGVEVPVIFASSGTADAIQFTVNGSTYTLNNANLSGGATTTCGDATLALVSGGNLINPPSDYGGTPNATVVIPGPVNSITLTNLGSNGAIFGMYFSPGSYYKLSNFSGSASGGGNTVTVTTSGSAGFAAFYPCGHIASTPYYFTSGAGTFTYSFSSATQSVIVPMNFASSGTAGQEHFDVNGSGVTLTSGNLLGGVSPNCGDNTLATISGGDLVNTGDFSGTPNQTVSLTGSITSVSIQNVPVGTNAADFGVYYLGASASPAALSFSNGGTQSQNVCLNTATSINGWLSATSANTGANVTWSIVSNPSNGTLSGFPYSTTSTGGTITPSGLTYTPTTGFTGSDAFQIQVSDGVNTVTTVVNVTVLNPPSVTSFSTTATTPCQGNPSTVTINSTSLTAGTYNVTYNLTGTNSATGVVSSVTMASNTGSFNTASLANSGVTTIQITSIANAAGCSSSVTSGGTVAVNVNSAPGAIFVPGSVCVGSTITLTDGTSGGTWTSSNTSDATVGSASGVVTGITGSTPTITYTLGTGCFATAQITVNPTPNGITGSNIICTGTTTNLTETSVGGTWSSSNTSLATVNSSGVVTAGSSAGNVTISYTFSTGPCFATFPMTINATPPANTGTTNVCTGLTTTLANTIGGGVWTSSNTAVATVGSTTGVVTGQSAGTPDITYTAPDGCTAVTPITVNTTPPAITGANNVCVASSTTLSNSLGGGTWTSSNNLLATVGSSSGVVTGQAVGNPNISYTMSTGCFAVQPMTVNANPVAIGGATFQVCTGSTITLTDATAGGTWSSSNTGLATVGSTSGVVTGQSAGTPTISYTMGTSCFVTQQITVNTTPSAISGSNTICVGANSTYTSTTGGGAWSTSDGTVVAIGTGTGIATGMGAGTANITYTMPTGCFVIKAVTVNSNPAAIGGTFTVCTGTTTTLTDATSSGTWSSSNSVLASVNPATGVVTGNSAGNPIISYTLGTGCFATQVITVNTSPAAIGGPTTVCVGSSITMTDATSGGTWASSSTGLATVGSTTGVVTGQSNGVPTITYTAPNGCIATQPITVNSVPGSISGSSTVCSNASTVLTDPTSGGTWSSSDGTKATVGASTGTVSGVAAGNVTISYTLATGCYVTWPMTVNAAPTAITGVTNVCVGASTTLSDGIGGGTWSSSNSSLATVGASSGTVNGVAAGVPTISYVFTATGCFVTTPVTVNANPSAIGGTPVVCVGGSTTLTDATSGGTWASNDVTTATIGSASGLLGGVNAGNAIISYTLSTGCYATTTATVNPDPSAITGTMSVCIGSSTTLSDATTGGTWSSSNSSIATVGAGSGTVNGVSQGVVTISYVITATGCYATTSVTVNPNPAAITGTPVVCVGATTPLFDATSGGLWSSSDNSLASIGGGSGVMSGVSAGNPIITYTLPTGCFTTTNATVNPLPAAVTGTMNVCVGLTTTLSDATSGGTWSSSNSSEASVVAGTGVVTGVAAGVPTISYVITATGCYATTPVTVNANPSAITGTAAVCTGYTTTLASSPSGGTWSSSNTAWGSVTSSTGVVTGISAAGNPTITYMLPTGCIATKVVTVNQTPVAIAGTATVCVGTTTTLTDATTGGTWSSSNTTQATIGSTSGIATGLAAGTPIISYIMTGTGCYNTVPLTVNALPANITGPSSVCTGSTIALSDATTGGTWSSSNSTWASVGSTTGVVTGNSAAGNPTITYMLPTGCVATYVVTVNQTPNAITGTMSVCTGSTTTLADATTGGSWSSSNTSEATVVSTTGVVTGISTGTPTISYAMPTGCYALANVTVNQTPAAITGSNAVCVGFSTSLSDATSGGSWSSSDASKASIDPSTGIMTGVSSGTATISYSMPSGCYVVFPVTVNTTPAAITGTTVVCAGSNTTLSDGTAGGTWSSANTGIATVGSASGVVTGVASGVATISYVTGAGCYVTTSYTVNPVPNISNFTSTVATSPCAGGTSTVTISSTSLGTGTFTVTYNLSGANSVTGAIATLTMGATNGTFTIPSSSLTSTGSTTVTVTGISNSYGCLTSPSSNNTSTFAVNTLPTVYNVLGGGAYCSGGSGVHIYLSNSVGGINYQLWLGGSTVGSPIAGTFSGLDFGSFTTAGVYTVTATNATTGCTSNMAGSATVSINPLPAVYSVTGGGSYCSGGTGVTVGLSSSSSGVNYQLYVGGTATGGPVGGTGSAISFGLQTTAGTYTVVATDASTGCTNNMTGSATVVINPLPSAITGTMFLCPATTTTLSDATGGGTWSSSTPAVATVGSTTGVVTGVTAGTSIITYALTSTGCQTTATVTVNSNPAAIAGPNTVCVGSAVTLTDATGSGTWSSSNSSLATINVSSGIVTGVAAGTPTMTYTLSTGCLATYAMTVNPTPASIGGTTNVCSGSTTTLTDATSGGTWSSSNSLVANVGSASGVVTGGTAGTATITYTLPAGCNTTTPFTTNPTPASIAGATSVCQGASTTLTDATSGGTWTTSNSAIATVGATSGTVVGVAAGSVTITYTLPAGCYTVYAFTVNPSPASIAGTSNICFGASTTLTDATSGGTWSSSNPAIAAVGSTTGIVNGAGTGNATITYTLPAGCNTTFAMTVNPNPAAISGTPSVCVGSTTALTDATTGGSWSSSNTTLATVSGSGVVTGNNPGVPIISYTLGTGCFATVPVTVNSNPPAITGVLTVCETQTTTLSDATTGGTWTSAVPGTATVGSSSGVVTGVSAGTVTITYTLPTGCFNTAVVTVNPQPAAITGASFVCVGQTTTLSDATSLGSWTSSNTSLATVSSSGVVTGVNTGVPVITYMLPAGCYAVYPISVNPMPASITGTTNVCSGLSSTLSDATAGGTWSSSNTAVGTVGSTSGVVTGITGGTTTITYTLPGGCFVTTPFTVNQTPVAITGSNNVCLGQTTTLTDGSSGGSWSSSNTSVAPVGSSSGIVTGSAAGTATITYTLPAGSCFTTLPFTVNALPAAITGTTNVCIGLTTTLSDATTGGSWSSSNTAIVTIGTSSGIASGVAAGTATITYTLPTGCTATTPFTVNALPTVYTMTGGGGYCAGGTGATVGLSNSQSGVNYQLYVGGVATGTPVSGTGAAISFGLQTTAGTYTAIATNATTGCVNNMSGTSTVTINNLPTVYNMTGGGGYCSGGTGVAVGLNNATAGITYQLYYNGTLFGSAITPTTSGALSFGTFTGAGTYTAVATNLVTGCSANMSGTAVISINPLPTAYTVTGGGGYCAGGTGVSIGLSNSTLGVSYTVSNGTVSATVPGTGSAISFGSTFTSTGTYTVSAINSSTGCTNTMLGSATVTINPLPLNTYVLTGGGAYCAGTTGVNVGLSGSQTGVNYQLMVGGAPTGPAIAGGSVISFGLQTAPGTYTVVATNATTGCSITLSSSTTVTVNSLPAAFTVTGGGGYCAGGTGVSLGLTGSASGVTYSYYRVGTSGALGSASGTGSAITFGSTLTVAGTYTVNATSSSTGCSAPMTGSATVVVNPLPNLYNVTGGGTYCAGGTGVAVGLSGSDLGISYQLTMSGSPVGASVAGTGSSLSFGLQTTPGTYNVVGSNPVTGCVATMSSSALVTVNPLPTAYNVTGGGSYCAGGAGSTIGLSNSAVGVSYQLMLGTTPVGIPVLGSGSSITFGSVTVAGTYTVQATTIATGCVNTMTGVAVVAVNPLPTVNNVTGGGSYCAGGAGLPIGLNGSVSGNNYQLFRGATMIGASVAGTGSAISFGTFAPAGTYTVTATSSITGCTAAMNGSAIISINAQPTSYTVTGGGAYCIGGTGMPVGLSSSDTGISYQLMLGSTAMGAPVAGTGSAISFGPQTLSGSYTVVATNNSTLCAANMGGSVVITINSLPATFTVTGGGNYCPGGTGVTISLSGSASGVNYQLYLGSSPVGAMVPGTGVAITFGPQTGTGVYTVVAIDAATTCTRTMTGTAVVGLSPLPTAFNVTGGGGYCAGGTGSSIALSGSSAGVNYQLYLGAAPVGVPMPGTGSALNFGLHTPTGIYTIVGTSSATGCSATMNGADTITLNPLPTPHAVTGGGGYCAGGAGVVVGLAGSDLSISYQLKLGATSIGSPLAGTTGPLSFGLITVPGSYTVVATNSITGCTNNMTGSATVSTNPHPLVYTVTGGGAYCAGGAGEHVMLSSSDAGINYQLFNGTSTVGSPVGGTGTTLDFGSFTAAGVYTVTATDAVTGCTSNMASSATISINPLPTVYSVTGGGSYCAGGSGVTVSLSGSNSGINYQLMNGSSTVGSPVAGTGSGISFGPQTAAGTYTVVATNATTGCTMNMTGSATVIINPLPNADTVTGGGNYCPGGAGVHVGTNTSSIGVNYQLMRGTTMVGLPLAGTGSGLDFGSQTIVGTYFVVATNPTTGCTNNLAGSTAVNVSALPTVFTVASSSSGYCAGGSGVAVTLSGSAIGTQYQLYRGTLAVGPATAGTGFLLNFGLQTSPGTYSVVATSTSTGCLDTMSGMPAITINPLPTVYTVSGGGSICAGAPGVDVMISGSDMGVNYQLMNGSTTVGSPVAGTGYSINFGPHTSGGTYTVVATNAVTGCTSNMLSSATITVNTPPTMYFVTGGGSYCAGDAGVHIGVNASDTGVNYQLYNGSTAIGSPVAGLSGSAAIDFGAQTLAGTYHVIATNAGTGCADSMTGTATVAINALPTLFAISGGGNICTGGPGVHVGLAGSSTGVTYQLYNGSAIGAPMTGTGSAIDFGVQTAAGTYTVVARNATTSCTVNMSGSAVITISALPTAYTVTGGGTYCASTPGTNVGLSNSDMGINYQLYNGATLVGGAVGGPGGAFNFGLEPAGTYSVVATNASTGCTNAMLGTVTVTAIPTVTPSVTVTTGVGDTVCAGTPVTFTALATNGGGGPTFQWAVNGVPAGTGGSNFVYTPANGNVVSVVMTSDATCVLPATATGSVTMTVKPNVTPAVTISVTPGDTVCQGTTVVFTASPTWGGAAPVYSWLVNGTPLGSSNTFTYSPADGDVIFATMNSSYACVTTSAAVLSNNIRMSVDDNSLPVVTVSINPGTSMGTLVSNDTLVATVTGGGHNPLYQWSINGIPVPGATASVYIAGTLKNGDVVSCAVTKINTCGALIGSGMSVILSTNVGVQPVTATVSDIRLVPNPNKGIFTLKGSLGSVSDENVTVEITDMLGQAVYTTNLVAHNGNLDETIHLNSKLANGMYMVTLHSGADSKVFHMVIED